MSVDTIKAVHIGRGGYVLFETYQYNIDLVGPGHFCIHFPSGNQHADLQRHLDILKEYADLKDPKWYVGNSSKKYT